MANSLPIPDAVRNQPDAQEILRVWIANGRQHFSLHTTWEDPAAWGLMLADLARHVANAYARQGNDRDESLRGVLNLLERELEHPTDECRDRTELDGRN